MPRWVAIVINLLGYDVAWTACMLGAAGGRPWLGVAVAALPLTLHLALSPVRAKEAVLLVVGSTIGVAIDTTMVVFGVFAYGDGPEVSLEFLAVFILLWLNFGTTLRVALRWAWRRLWIGSLLGLGGGPLAYFAASRLGAITLPESPAFSLATIGVIYGLATPLWLYAASRTLSETGPAETQRENPSGPPSRTRGSAS